MSDGRLVTDYRDKCVTRAPPGTQFAVKSWTIQNTDEIIRLSRVIDRFNLLVNLWAQPIQNFLLRSINIARHILVIYKIQDIPMELELNVWTKHLNSLEPLLFHLLPPLLPKIQRARVSIASQNTVATHRSAGQTCINNISL